MKEDYLSSSFNSYNEGPGKYVQRSPKNIKTRYTLFVDHIPVMLTQVS